MGYWDCPSGKRTYYKEKAAQRAVSRAASRGEMPPLRYYRCAECERWHLTTDWQRATKLLPDRWNPGA